MLRESLQCKAKILLMTFFLMELISLLKFSPHSLADDAVIARVISSKDDTSSDVGRLWFIVENGSSVVKKLAIYNNSKKSAQVTISFLPSSRDSNGQLKIDRDIPFLGEKFFTLSKKKFIMRGNSVQVVEVRATSPENIDAQSFDFYLKVSSRVLGAANSQTEGGVGVKIPVATAFALPGFLGLGSFEDQNFAFSIKEIEGSLDKNGNESIRIILANDGNVPMRFSGKIQLSSLELSSARTDQLVFKTKIFPAGFRKYVDVILPSFIDEGSYKVYLELSNGRLSKKELRNIKLEFPYPKSLVDIAAIGLIGILSLTVLFLSLSYLGSGKDSFLIQKFRLLRGVQIPSIQSELKEFSDSLIPGHTESISNGGGTGDATEYFYEPNKSETKKLKSGGAPKSNTSRTSRPKQSAKKVSPKSKSKK
jgi:hypothetical protein